MNKTITISCTIAEKQHDITIGYTMQMEGDMHKISCTVAGTTLPNWLQLRKFEMVSLKEKTKYIPLFNEINNGKNMATVLFIDQAYTEIMAQEKLKIMDAVADVAKA